MVDRRDKVGMKVRIPLDLHAQVSLILMDTRTGRVEYGGWTGLMEMLLRRFVREQQQASKESAA